ncbi:MAG: hypothetical protein L0922_04870, partial [Candidatus Mariimomonas ferrooxydans]
MRIRLFLFFREYLLPSSAIAVADAYLSRQPKLPHLHFLPSSFTVVCPAPQTPHYLNHHSH